MDKALEAGDWPGCPSVIRAGILFSKGIRMLINFVKMHGLGNDFIVLGDQSGLGRETIRRLCRRRYGIGADGLLTVSKTGDNKIRMRYWNADGSQADICGNGLRCAVRHALDRGWLEAGEITVETDAGLRFAYWDGTEDALETQLGRVVYGGEKITLHGLDFHIADVGNPHAIAFLPPKSDWPDISSLGPQVENHQRFPQKTNVELVKLLSADSAEIVFWERGVGETPACATGMVSAMAVAHKLGKISLPAKVLVAGGRAKVWLDADGCSRLLAPALLVCSGQLEVDSRQPPVDP